MLEHSSLQTEYLNIDISQSGYSEHNEKANSAKASAHIVDFLTILWKNVLKISEKKKRKLVLLVLRLTKFQIV